MGKTRTRIKVADKSKPLVWRKSLKGLKISRLWKNGYARATFSVLLVLGSIVPFWFGLRATFKSDYPLFPIECGSMSPTLNIGDLVVVQGLPNASEIKAAEKTEGDIILFRKPSNPNELIVQRAINKTLVNGVWYIRTQGDNASSPYRCSKGQKAEDTWGDGYFHQKFLIGKVAGKIPYLGYIPLSASVFLRTPEAIFLLVVFTFFVILLKYPSLRKKKVENAR